MIGSPLHGRTGTTLSYVVSLMNVPSHGPVSNRPFKVGSFRSLLPCPSYVESLMKHNKVVAKERHVLNCSVVGIIPGNVAVSFAMWIQIPLGVIGKAKLIWVLDPPSASRKPCAW